MQLLSVASSHPMIGGVGYVANALLSYVLPDAGLAVHLPTTATTVGELWMVGYP